MNETITLNRPWLVAVWPGMGHVALNAGVYLLSKLGMTAVAELDTGDLFDIDHVDVKEGIIQVPRRPRSRIFIWRDPNGRHDLILFLGEAQPPLGQYAFCRNLILFAKAHGVERVLTFAAMATQMHPEHESRVFAAATDQTNLDELKRLELTVLQEGRIGGLNGVLLGAAAEAGLPGACLLGEMPHIFTQMPFPKASLAILEVFTAMARIELDLSELQEQARAVNEKLGELLARLEEQYRQQTGEETEDNEFEEGLVSDTIEQEPPPEISEENRQRIEAMFDRAKEDRSKAFELKQELDRLGLFKEYEDRFLDLFKKAA